MAKWLINNSPNHLNLFRNPHFFVNIQLMSSFFLLASFLKSSLNYKHVLRRQKQTNVKCNFLHYTLLHTSAAILRAHVISRALTLFGGHPITKNIKPLNKNRLLKGFCWSLSNTQSTSAGAKKAFSHSILLKQ